MLRFRFLRVAVAHLVFGKMKKILFLLPCLLMASCYSAYQKRDSGWTFVEWNAGVGYRASPVRGADPASFRVLSDPEFAVDKRAVYWRNWTLDGADPRTFRELTKGYWRDRAKVFEAHYEIKGADPDTFRLLPVEPWALDKHDAYRGFEPVHVADLSTFTVLSPTWAKDSKAYYAGAPGKPRKVPCDYASFAILNAEYGKDKNHAYWFGLPIPGSDAKSFRVLDESRAQDKFREYSGPNPK